MFDANMDKSVRPGDDFFMHCVGTWWKDAVIPANTNINFFLEDVAGEGMKKFQTVLATDANFLKFQTHIANIYSNVEADAAALDEAEKKVAGLAAKEDLWKLMGELSLAGYQMPYRVVSLSKEGRMRLVFLPPTGLEIVSTVKPQTMAGARRLWGNAQSWGQAPGLGRRSQSP